MSHAIKCAYMHCENTFIIESMDAIKKYCSVKCQRAAQKQRTRARNKEARNANRRR